MLKEFWGHRVTRNASALVVVQLSNYITPFLVLVYLTRTLGIETYGVVAFSISMTQMAFVVLDLGFTLSATQKISVWRDKKRVVARFIGAVFYVKSAAFLLVASVLITYAMTTEKYEDYYVLFVLSLLPLLGTCFQPVWFFSAIERMKYLTIFLVLAKVLSLVLVVTLVSDEADYFWVPIADGIAQLTAATIALVLLYRVGYHIAAPRSRDVKYVIRMTSGFFVSRLSATVYLSSGVFLLGLFSTPAAAALYALSEQIYRAIQSVFAPIVQAIYPYMAKEKDLALLGKVTLGIFGVAVAGAIVGYLVTPYVIPWLFGTAWDGIIPVVNVFLLAITIHVLTVMSGYPLAAALGRLDVANRSVVYGSVIYILGAVGLLATDRASPIAYAWLMIGAESYVLLHRALALWPEVYRFLLQPRNLIQGE
jgi:O-antigen/teichoic acid export membrane protein